MTQSTLPPLVAAMLKPEFYDHPVVEPIRVMQTHVSFVLLTGEYVYKIKKPVNFGFLDYSTLEQRRHFCNEELRLNQRGASSLYLKVVALTEQEEGFTLEGSGPPVEYAVKMRQFPQSALLSNQFEKGLLDAEKIRQLAVTIAQFHQSTMTNAHIRSYGTVEAIRQAFDENYAQTVDFVQFVQGEGEAVTKPQTKKQYDETKAYTDDFFATREDLFQRRLDQNRIRACHGDLHLGNICEWKGRLLLFDCIEFNEPFRYVDVMYDVAYVVMDLEVGGRSDLSTLFLNQYVEETGDWEGLEILPLYVSRQAYVRAKVTSFMLADPSVSESDRKAASAKAARYYHLAWAYGQKKSGAIVAMVGLSGSGKSTTARALAQQTGAIHLRSDAVRKHLAGVPLREKGGDDLYTPQMSDRTYERLIALGVQLAAAGYRVILDAKFDRKERRLAAISAAAARQIPLTLLHCAAPQAVLQSRLQVRTGDIADATPEILAQQTLDPLGEEPLEAKASIQTIDTTAPLDFAAIADTLAGF